MAIKFLLCSLATLACTTAVAQSIRGTVADSTKRQPMVAATVVLMRHDSSIVKTVSTGKAGRFIIDEVPDGNFLLSIRFLGYQPFCCKSIISSSAKTITLAPIFLSPLTQQLQGVNVQAKRPPAIEHKIDGLVYNPQGDLVAAGSNAQELLQRVPFVTVSQDGMISIRGNSSVRVFINNKPAEFYAGNVSDLLKQLSADDIAKVEVITHPSARYDAEGSAGILHIWLKKNRLRGLTGSVTGNMSNLNMNGHLKLNYRLTKFYAVSEVYLYRSISYNDEISVRSGNTGFQNKQYSRSNANTRGNYFTLNMGWEPDSTQALDISTRYATFPNWREDFLHAEQFIHNDRTRAYDRNTSRKSNYAYMGINASYSKRFRKERELFILGGYSSRMNQSAYTTLQFENGRQTYQEMSDNEGSNYDLVLQADYIHPFFKKQKLEAGLKYAYREVNSDYVIFSFDTALGYEKDPFRSMRYHFDQSVSAAYTSYEISLGDLKLRTGLRYEHTQPSARHRDSLVRLQAYGVLVPNIIVSKTLSKKTIVNLSYSRRIQRPEAYHLTPTSDYSDSLNITEGNPDLVPEKINRFELGLSTIFANNSSLNFSVYHAYTNNSIQSIRTMGPTGVIYNSYANITGNSKTGLSFSGAMNIGRSFKVNTNGNLYHTEFTNSGRKFRYNAGQISVSATYQFKKGFAAEGGSSLETRYPLVYGYIQGWRSYYIGVNKKLWGDRAAASLRCQSFLNPHHIARGEFFGDTYTESLKRRFRNQVVRIGFTYKFGKAFNTRPERVRRSVEGM